MTKKIITVFVLTALLSSCVSTKKYSALEQDLIDTKGELQKTTVEKEALETKFAKIEKRVEIYNSKINSLQQDNTSLQESNDEKMAFIDENGTVLSKDMRDNLEVTLSNLSSEELAGAKTLKDSMNLAISYKLNKAISENSLNDNDDININIDKTVVMISVADSLLFRSGSYRVNPKAYSLLKKLADIVN
jgi:chemotaxis protein MotB